MYVSQLLMTWIMLSAQFINNFGGIALEASAELKGLFALGKPGNFG